MLNALIENKVYYKIFDKTFQHLTHRYSVHRATDEAKLTEVKNNLLKIKQELAAEQLIVLKQTHSTIVIDSDNITDFEHQFEGDALVTTKRGLAIGALTADCVPVLISSTDGKVIGAAHCGWKGAKNNIIINLIEMMKSKEATSFKAVIGPAIAQESYEVNEERYQDCLNTNPFYQQFFIASIKKDHYMLDVSAMVAWQLRELDITDIVAIKEDTYTNPAKYPSHRRDCHQGNLYYQNIFSTIIIR